MKITVFDGSFSSDIVADPDILNEISFYLGYAVEKLRENNMSVVADRADDVKLQIYSQLKSNGYYDK